MNKVIVIEGDSADDLFAVGPKDLKNGGGARWKSIIR
jgi:hypothetical protein